MSTLRWKDLKAGKVVYYIDIHSEKNGSASIARAVIGLRAKQGRMSVSVAHLDGDTFCGFKTFVHTLPGGKPYDPSARSNFYYGTLAQAKAAQAQQKANVLYAVTEYRRNILKKHPDFNWGMDAIVKKFGVDIEVIGRLAFELTNKEMLESRRAAKEMRFAQ